ncbi:MAG: ribbon-helix-helix domain-containing protein [Actinomycetia bacterium]|nr:ribbon-helix-helix domain-containing protein [Actinomycetes bacterium]
MTISDKEAQQLADWAENEMNPSRRSASALRGEAAAAFGRETVVRALGGRPSLDPHAAPGRHSRVRQVRLPADADSNLDQLAAAQHRNPSDIMRAALEEYFRNHADQLVS